MTSAAASLSALESLAADLLNSECALKVIRCFRHRAVARWRIPKQQLKDHLLYFVHSGSIWMQVNESEYIWQAGDVFWVPSGCRVHARGHDCKNLGQPIFDVARFNLQGHEDVWSRQGAVVKVSGSADARVSFAALERCLTLRKSWLETAARSALAAICVHILDASSQNDSKLRLSPRQRRDLHSYLRNHIGNEVTAVDLANHLNVTPARLRKVMVREFGISPRTWISRERMRLVAEQLSQSNAAVALVAERCGYRSLTSFYRLFGEQFGMTPVQWRQQADPRNRLGRRGQ